MPTLQQLHEQLVYLTETPLTEQLADTHRAQATADGVTAGWMRFGVGIASNINGTLQLGGEGARLITDPPSGTLAAYGDTQCHGDLALLPATPTQGLSFNQGALNPELVPPSFPRGAQYAPSLALLTTRALAEGPSSTAHPATQPCVEIPDHIHKYPEGLTMGVDTWQPGGHTTTVPLRGVEYQYLFGHTRVLEQLQGGMQRVYAAILGDR
jgi:hypothetical protein